MIRTLDKQDRVFRALGHATRREILDRCTVMQHLGVLERADLVVGRTQGRLRWNVLNVLPIMDIHDRWIGPYAANAAGLLARLKRHLERGPPARVERGSRRTTSR
jgi:DNA-binding transcriptional ArsR family regulator